MIIWLGGAIFINNLSLMMKAEIVREKGTNRAAYFRGEIDKYEWKSLGSSYLLSDILAAKLLSQLEALEQITRRRKIIWQHYYDFLQALESEGKFRLPIIPEYANHNGHMFYLVCKNGKERSDLLTYLRKNIAKTLLRTTSLTSLTKMRTLLISFGILSSQMVMSG